MVYALWLIRANWGLFCLIRANEAAPFRLNSLQMSLNESIAEDAALEWFGELGYAVGHGPHLAPGEYAGGTLIPAFSQGERESYSEVVLLGRLREAIRRLNPAIPSRTLATLRDNLLSGELSVAADSVIRESRITAADGPGQSAASRTRRKTAR